MKDYYTLSCKLRKIYKERFRTKTKRETVRRTVERRKSFPYEIGFVIKKDRWHYNNRISIYTTRKTFSGKLMPPGLNVCFVISKMKVGNRVMNYRHNYTFGWKVL